MGEFNPSFTFTKQEFKNYCTCTSDKVTERFTVKELVLLESKITKSSKNDEVKTLLANKKMERCSFIYIYKICKKYGKKKKWKN